MFSWANLGRSLTMQLLLRGWRADRRPREVGSVQIEGRISNRFTVHAAVDGGFFFEVCDRLEFQPIRGDAHAPVVALHGSAGFCPCCALEQRDKTGVVWRR